MSNNRLQHYKFDDYQLVTNFANFQDAVQYAHENQGELIEIGFTDGTDAVTQDDSVGLIAKQKVFEVVLDSDYTVLYSDDERFQELAQELLVEKKKLENDVALEDWLADQNIATGDRIIVLRDGEVNTITTRERIKYLMKAKLYEVAVKLNHVA